MLSQLVTSLCIFTALGAASAHAQSVKDRPSVPTEMREQVQNTYIVTLDPTVSSFAVRATAAEAAGLDRAAEVRAVYTTVISGFSVTLPAGAASQLLSLPNVVRVEKDQIAYSLHHREGHNAGGDDGGGGGPGGGKGNNKNKDTTTGDVNTAITCASPGGGEQTDWGVQRIGSAAATGAGVHVYVIDTGIDADHADLCPNLSKDSSGNMIGHFAYETCTGGSCLADWDDDDGHGTHVAGTIAAAANGGDVVGVAPESILHAVKVLNGQGSGTYSGVIAGIDFVAQQASGDAPVIANMSLGGGASSTLDDALRNARLSGVILAVAAGNSGADAEGYSPARSQDVITISATSGDADPACGTYDNWPYWSNWGNNEGGSQPVDLAAPGVSILSTKAGGGTTRLSGTSMASPHAAGALSLWLEQQRSLDPDVITDAADDFDDAYSAIVGTANSEATSGGCWANTSGNSHSERFLNVSNF